MTLPSSVHIVEVGPRDGLQNEPNWVDTATKIALIQHLGEAGLKTIEATAFVSPKRVPQMSGSSVVLSGINRMPGVTYPVLTPNMQGYQAARAAGATEIAVFGAASESFSQKNIQCSVAESIERFRPVAEAARQDGIKVRGYLSCVIDCPYEGAIPPGKVADTARLLFELGCEEISLGDTIGTGTPERVKRMLDAVASHIPLNRLAGHFHDTYGMAIANIYAALQMGVSTFDASVAGLGGCPYAPGASGNVATEDVIWLMNGLGIETGVDLTKLVGTAAWISQQLKRPVSSKVGKALHH